MEILEKTTMPDGTKIQIEDWKENYSFVKTLSITTYPIMKRLPVSRKSIFYKENKPFRLELDKKWKSDTEVYEVFEALKTGKMKIEDCKKYFRESWYSECI